MPLKEFVPCCNDLHDCACATIHRKLEEAKNPANWQCGFGAEYFSTEYLEDQFTSAYNACLINKYGVKMSNEETGSTL